MDLPPWAVTMTAEEWIYRFGDVQVEPGAHRITRDGVELRVEPKAFAVLVALLEQSGKALERDDLLDRVWGHRHVTPGVLNRVVAQLRKALGDDAEHPLYIQTLHSLGYRFVAEVERIPAQVPPREESEPVCAGDAASGPEESTTDAHAARWSWQVLAACSLFIAMLAWFARDASSPAHGPVAASVAVLPFTSLSNDPDDRYFAEGLAVEMHGALAGVPGLKVAARIAPTPQSRTADIKAVCAKLGVASVLDASVRRDQDRLRINARLSDCSTGYTLWSRRYDRLLTDVFATQNEIAGEVVNALVGVLPDAGKGLQKRLMPTKNLAAFDAYLRGLQAMLSDGNTAATDAVGYFQQALAEDKGFARAQAAICRVKTREFENYDAADAYGDAAAACSRAKEMDPSAAEVDLALGDLYRARGDLARALEHYRKVQNDPDVATWANVGLAMTYAAQERKDLAFKHFQRALELSPGNAFIHSGIGYQQYLDGQLPEAIASYRIAVKLQPNDAGLWATLGSLYLAKGDNTQASKMLERSIAISPDSEALTNLGLIRYQSGDYTSAVVLHRRATQLDPQHHLLWANLADALQAAAQGEKQVRAAWLQASSRAESYLQIRPDDAEAVAGLALYRAHLGDAAQARALVARSVSLQDENGEAALLDAETMALLGDLEQARHHLARARAAGIPAREIASNLTFRRVGLIHANAGADPPAGSPSTTRGDGQGKLTGGG